ncbi:MAG: T9SS type A sorting domain-containing protein, partial [Bacteroidetes bacterium]|nr:T9SS type A sorting domain-containing protein [Bacteroidota bacterium]
VSPYYKFVYIIGDFTSATVTFDTVTLVNASSSRDNFVMKYNETGSVSWANQITGTDNEYGCFIAVDWKENVYVTGQFESGVCSFDSLQLLNSSSSKEVYLVSYDYYGNVNWVNGMFGENDDIVYSITSDMSNGVYICGWFNSYSLTVGNDVLSTNGGYDIFISKFDFSGNYYWTKQCGNSDNDYAECLISDQTGNLYVTGVFNSSELDFDSITLTNSGSDDIYIGKLAVNTTSLYTYEEAGFTSPFYPNPASETIYTNRISTIRIYSCNGRPVFDSGSDKIDVSGLKNGLYIICIDGRYYKFVKM